MDVIAQQEERSPAAGLLAETIELLGAGLALVVDELAHGVVVLSAGDARVLHMNQAARHEIGRRQVLTVRGRTLLAPHADDQRQLQDALVRACEGKRSLLTLAAGGGPSLTFTVLPLKGEGPPRAALVLARSTLCDPVMLCFYARCHGLTPTEEQVLAVLCQGFSAPDVAAQLGVAVSTVRSHVRSLCAKTRSSGVRELVNRVAVLPPVAPAFWQQPVH